MMTTAERYGLLVCCNDLCWRDEIAPDNSVVYLNLLDPLARYVERAVPCGDFLMAVLRNDLFNAMGRADIPNQVGIHRTCMFIYNHLPGNCWGSPEKVKAFLDDGGGCGRITGQFILGMPKSGRVEEVKA